MKTGKRMHVLSRSVALAIVTVAIGGLLFSFLCLCQPSICSLRPGARLSDVVNERRLKGLPVVRITTSAGYLVLPSFLDELEESDRQYSYEQPLFNGSDLLHNFYEVVHETKTPD
jgi:hypothetical protein